MTTGEPRTTMLIRVEHRCSLRWRGHSCNVRLCIELVNLLVRFAAVRASGELSGCDVTTVAVPISADNRKRSLGVISPAFWGHDQGHLLLTWRYSGGFRRAALRRVPRGRSRVYPNSRRRTEPAATGQTSSGPSCFDDAINWSSSAPGWRTRATGAENPRPATSVPVSSRMGIARHP